MKMRISSMSVVVGIVCSLLISLGWQSAVDAFTITPYGMAERHAQSYARSNFSYDHHDDALVGNGTWASIILSYIPGASGGVQVTGSGSQNTTITFESSSLSVSGRLSAFASIDYEGNNPDARGKSTLGTGFEVADGMGTYTFNWATNSTPAGSSASLYDLVAGVTYFNVALADTGSLTGTLPPGHYMFGLGELAWIGPSVGVLSPSFTFNFGVQETAAVPLPAASLLFGSGLIVLVLGRRRKREGA